MVFLILILRTASKVTARLNYFNHFEENKAFQLGAIQKWRNWVRKYPTLVIKKCNGERRLSEKIDVTAPKKFASALNKTLQFRP